MISISSQILDATAGMIGNNQIKSDTPMYDNLVAKFLEISYLSFTTQMNDRNHFFFIFMIKLIIKINISSGSD